MKHEDNVVPFDPMRRGGMARRGAPDKSERTPSEALLLACPVCASPLRLDADGLDGETDLLCGRCEAEISLGEGQRGVR